MRRIDEEKERQVIELYREKKLLRDEVQRLSMDKVAALLDTSRATVHRVLMRNNERRRSISEAKMKYPKTDFSDDSAELARIIGLVEDCEARYNWRQISVATTTTHPAQISWFTDALGTYGHVGKTSAFNRSFLSYQWRVWVDLNGSFDFLLEYKRAPTKFLAEIAEGGYEIVRIASLADAEGWVGIELNKGRPQPALTISNNSRELLEFTQRTIGGCMNRSKSCHQLVLRRGEAVEALRILPLMHAEKVAAKELILRHHDNGGIGPEALKEYKEFRHKVDEEVRLCVLQARLDWIRRHGEPHRYDPDRTTPAD